MSEKQTESVPSEQRAVVAEATIQPVIPQVQATPSVPARAAAQAAQPPAPVQATTHATSQAAPQAGPQAAPAPPPQAKRSLAGTLIIGVATLAGVLIALYAWRLPPFRSAIESTENAYVRGNVTIIAPKVNGYVARVTVQDFGAVEAGAVLVQLEDREYRQRVDQARAQLAAQRANLDNVDQARRVREAQVANTAASILTAHALHASAAAQLERAEADFSRTTTLVADGSVSRKEHDQVQASLRQSVASQDQASAAIEQARAANEAAQQELRAVIVNRRAVEAAVENAKAALQLAEIDLDNTRIRAPRAGHVGEVGVKLGQYVVPGTQLMSLVPESVWVIANFKEAQTAHIAPGQKAWIEVDALAHQKFEGVVERISPATGSEFSVLRPDNATGNFTKVPQRLPVRIRLDGSHALAERLRPGMSVVASIDTRVDHAMRADAVPGAYADSTALRVQP